MLLLSYYSFTFLISFPLLARTLPYKLGLMLAAVAGVGAGMLAEAWSRRANLPNPTGTP